MEQHRSVREARRTFSEILNTASYGDQRIVIVRHKTEVGAFVNMKDLEFLRRYRPGGDSIPASETIELDLVELEQRERLHESQARLPGGNESWRRDLALDRELLDAERAWLTVLLAVAKRCEAVRN